MYSLLEKNINNICNQQKLKKPHRLTTYTEPIGDATEGYSFKKGVVWIGEKL